MKKIAVIGSGGSGKSTFARALNEKLQIEAYHLDALLWKPGWQPTSKTEQQQIQQQLIQQEQWIIDGNYNGTLDIRLHAADTIIFLDLPRHLCLYRALKRRWQFRNKQRPDMAAGCEEKISFDFLKWIWQYPKAKRPNVLHKLVKLTSEKNIVILTSPKQTQAFLNNLHNKK